VERPGLWRDACFPVRFGTRFARDRTGWAGDVKVLIDYHGLGDQDHLSFAAPGPQFDHHEGQVLGESFKGWPVPTSGAFNDQDGDMGLALKAHAIAGPVVEDPETVGCVDFPELYLNAVVGVTVCREDIQAAAPGGGKLLRDDSHLPQTQAGRVSGEPVLQPNFVVAKLAQLRRLARAHREPRMIHRHKRSE